MSSNTDGNPPLQASLTHGMRDCKRYISGHDGDKSVFLESPELLYTDAGGAYAVARSFALERVPAPLTGDQDLENYLSKDGETKVTSYVNSSITIPDGVNIIVVNFAPGGKSAMHRTVSVDFVVCVDGEIECELDNGDKRTLRLG
ncbi:hypothetical protein MMC08_006787, partial [Hypocenomyce scalaris]|nr:hypothetical protein [Hypocenomyce scalaris]